ncbi:MAG: type I-C CRISPR-associated protein Cas8c/Csd1 [Kiritimatiellae bacterium]|nr:type I-C CRISPR-associated protein Cas8c/Csd1 [Kiritimatiellia bacterium]
MILQALTEYYDRKAADPDSGIARPGWEWKEIPYLIIIQGDGSLVHVEDTQEFVGKKKRAKTFLVPQSVKRSSGVVSNLLWDNVEYATGIVCKGKKERVLEQHKAFCGRLNRMSALPAVKSICAFLANAESKRKLSDDPVWKEAVETCAFVSFRIVDQQEPVFRQKDVVEAIDNMGTVSENDVAGRRCLVSGNLDVIAKLHPAIKGVQGANTTGGNIVSFNFPASCSFGKKQGENAQISESAAFKYTTALNSLLSKDSRQKMSVGDATVVFWSEKKTALEDEFIDLFGEPAKDNPDKGVAAVERLLSSVRLGSFFHEPDATRFYVLGLAPNSARISVRFWHVGAVAEMERRFADWFDNLRIVHGPREKEHLSLWRLLVSIAPLGKSENIPPNLAGAVMRSILEGTPYPATLLSSALVRIKAERDVTYPRAKLIKAFLNHNKERKLTVSLDKENPNIGYRLGRLFAILEKIQEEANPGVNATIRDKFYASASSMPNAVFGNLMRLKNHHLGKLSQGRSIYFEKLLGEVIAEIPSFPAHLSLDEQGDFAIGYYHQRQDFFTKKESPEKQNPETV